MRYFFASTCPKEPAPCTMMQERPDLAISSHSLAVCSWLNFLYCDLSVMTLPPSFISIIEAGDGFDVFSRRCSTMVVENR